MLRYLDSRGPPVPLEGNAKHPAVMLHILFELLFGYWVSWLGRVKMDVGSKSIGSGNNG